MPIKLRAITISVLLLSAALKLSRAQETVARPATSEEIQDRLKAMDEIRAKSVERKAAVRDIPSQPEKDLVRERLLKQYFQSAAAINKLSAEILQDQQKQAQEAAKMEAARKTLASLCGQKEQLDEKMGPEPMCVPIPKEYRSE